MASKFLRGYKKLLEGLLIVCCVVLISSSCLASEAVSVRPTEISYSYELPEPYGTTKLTFFVSGTDHYVQLETVHLEGDEGIDIWVPEEYLEGVRRLDISSIRFNYVSSTGNPLHLNLSFRSKEVSRDASSLIMYISFEAGKLMDIRVGDDDGKISVLREAEIIE